VIDYLDEIVGQSTAKRFIRTALKKENLYNFLFVGPRGVGKRHFGFALAKQLGCPPRSPNFTLIAPIPSRIKNKEEQIYEYSKQYLPENPIKETEDRATIIIEQVRTMIEHLVHMPVKGTRRVVLIIETDRMTDEAANCFLKTLEEPPIDTFFILTSSRPHYLLPTIRSRCRTVPFSYLTPKEIQEVVFEEQDEYILGSPGELLMIREYNLMEHAEQVFNRLPLAPAEAAAAAREFAYRTTADLLYPLLLLYRCVLYNKIAASPVIRSNRVINDKTNRLSHEEIIRTISMLNHSIMRLEQNPNKLLLLFNLLLKLP
jgi:DNA polymerase-3 subunit delta'